MMIQQMNNKRPLKLQNKSSRSLNSQRKKKVKYRRKKMQVAI